MTALARLLEGARANREARTRWEAAFPEGTIMLNLTDEGRAIHVAFARSQQALCDASMDPELDEAKRELDDICILLEAVRMATNTSHPNTSATTRICIALLRALIDPPA